MVTASEIQELRKNTGAGMMSCKKALNEANGDMEKAAEILRKKGETKAKERSGRESKEGIVSCYMHATNKLGALVELHCETDFVADNEEFKKLAYELAMHVAATQPEYLKPEDVPSEVIEKEKEIMQAQLKDEGKPENIWDKIIEGKLNKFYEEVCLLKQNYVKDPDIKIEKMVLDLAAKMGENIQLEGFTFLSI